MTRVPRPVAPGARIRVRAAALLLVGLAAACGDDTAGAPPAPTSTVPPVTAPASTTSSTSSTSSAGGPTDTVAIRVSLPFLDARTNALLQSCAIGEGLACAQAQAPGVLDDGAFSAIHQRCDAGDRSFCTLVDNLVAAEVRIHGRG